MTAVPAGTSCQSAAWVASDYWEMAKRSFRHIRHDPEQLANVTLQPVLIVVVADFLLGGAISTGTHGSYINFVMPGILVVAAAFAAVTTTVSVAADMLEGVIDRFRTLPMAKSAVITGHIIADLARSLLGLAVSIAAGYAVGFRPAAGIRGWATAVAVFLLITLALSLLAALIGLLGKWTPTDFIDTYIMPLASLSCQFRARTRMATDTLALSVSAYGYSTPRYTRRLPASHARGSSRRADG